MSVLLRCGDCLCETDGLPSLAGKSVDVIITDPPFDARTHRAALEVGDRADGKRVVAGALPFAPLTSERICELAFQFARTARTWIIIFAAERQLETWAHALETADARVVRFGIALRTNPRPQMSGDRPAPACDHVVIAHAGKGRMRWQGGGKAGNWRSPPARWDTDGKSVHPTQKPVALMRALVSDFSEPGDLICDPFSGSGTTALACKAEQRNFVGWEINSEYHATALRRLEASGDSVVADGRP
jgi:site-specific DNA-methyltransferase (adenine-specific)